MWNRRMDNLYKLYHDVPILLTYNLYPDVLILLLTESSTQRSHVLRILSLYSPFIHGWTLSNLLILNKHTCIQLRHRACLFPSYWLFIPSTCHLPFAFANTSSHLISVRPLSALLQATLHPLSISRPLSTTAGHYRIKSRTNSPSIQTQCRFRSWLLTVHNIYILSHPTASSFLSPLLYPILPYPILSYPILSHPILSLFYSLEPNIHNRRCRDQDGLLSFATIMCGTLIFGALVRASSLLERWRGGQVDCGVVGDQVLTREAFGEGGRGEGVGVEDVMQSEN